MQQTRYPRIDPSDYVRIGFVRRPHALGGELVAELDTDISPLVEEESGGFLMLCLLGLLVPFRLISYRERNDGNALIRLSGVSTKDEAVALQGTEIFIHHTYLDEEAEIDHWDQYIGYDVCDQTLKPLGRLTNIDESTINTLFEIQTADGRIVLLPAAEELIQGVDRAARQITLIIPEGLIELQ